MPSLSSRSRVASLLLASLVAVSGGSQAQPAPAGASNTPVEITAGRNHTCVRTSGGTVACWGENDSGQLGDGSRLDRAAPVPVAGLDHVTRVVAAHDATCALRDDGTVWCWGNRDPLPAVAGSLGPWVRPLAHPELGHVTDLVLSTYHGCALRRDGSVLCWGAFELPENRYQQSYGVRTPAGLANVRSLVAGNDYVCALQTDGSVSCWGGIAGRWPPQITPVAYPALGRAATAAVTSRGVCAADAAAGRVRCAPLAGAGATRGAMRPPWARDVRALAGRGGTLCAVMAAGEVRCDGGFDEAVLDPATLRLERASERVDGITSARAVAVGASHHCALTADGVWCWGANTHGQLGDDNAPFALVPTEVAGLRGARRVSLALSEACAVLDDGTARCWGRGAEGVLGDGGRRAQSRPVTVTAMTGIDELATSADHACARARDGRVACWGDGRANNARAPMFDRPVEIPALRGAAALAPAATWTGVLDAQGGVHLIVDTNAFAQSAIALARPLVQLDEGSCGGYPFGCGVRSDGSVVCFGGTGNAHGEYGTGARLPDGATEASPADVRDAVEVAVGECRACARRRDGRVSCWGQDFVSTDALTSSPPIVARTPWPVAGLDRAMQIAVADHHACARRDDGTVWCWGAGASGELGDGERTDRPRAARPAVNLRGARAIAAGGTGSCAVVQDGAVWCWGGDANGEVGRGRVLASRAPLRVLLPRAAAANAGR